MQPRRKPATTNLTPAVLEEMRMQLDILRSRIYAAKVAYMHRTPFEDRTISYEDLKQIANEYIQKSYAYQKARFGKVKVRISTAKLLR